MPFERQPGCETVMVTLSTWRQRPVFAQADRAELMIDTFCHHRDLERMELHAYVVLPAEIELILTPLLPLEELVNFLKTRFNLLSFLRGHLWEPGFQRRAVCDRETYEHWTRHVHTRAMDAGLAEQAEDYLFCSASGRVRLDPSPQFDR